MARTKLIPDSAVFAALQHLLATEGPQAASFRAVGRATGLAAATLVQRYGSSEGMLLAAMQDGWDQADAALVAAVAATDKGAVALLKALPPTPPLLIQPALVQRAAAWQQQVIRELAARLGDKQAAAIMFVAWQGRMMWQRTGARGFSLRDVQRRLT